MHHQFIGQDLRFGSFELHEKMTFLATWTVSNTHPFSDRALKVSFAVRRQDRYGFSAVAGDMALEQTMNRDVKVSGGLIGKTLNPNAVQRWVLSRPECAEMTRQAEKFAGFAAEDRPMKDLSKTRHKRDADMVEQVYSVIEEVMINPFTYVGNDVVNICSGAAAPSKT